MPERDKTVAVILAGGRSSRLGGADKALQPLAGRSLLAHVIERLTPQVEQLALNSNADPERFRTFGLPVIADVFGDYRGPLAGVHAGLLAFPAARVLTVAVDLPFLPHDLVARLARDWDGQRCRYAACQGQHRLAILWPPGTAGKVGDWLNSGQASVHGFLAAHGEPVAFPAADCAALDLNLNTPEAFRDAEKHQR
ncbi:MAG: molybdenum cofactor guanylyltransferase MobA [Pseudomonadota bacterium]